MNIIERAERRKARRRYNIKQKNQRGLPRLVIFRSNKNISAQIIDDKSGKILAACYSVEEAVTKKGYNKEGATSVGKEIAARALKNKINEVVFDIGSYKYHGRVAALVEAALSSGLGQKG